MNGRLALIGLLLLASACSTKPARDPNEPSASDIYVQKGVQYMSANQLDYALEDMKRAIELDGKNAAAYNAISVLYERLGMTAEADTSFQRALSLDPENFSTLNNYGRFLCAQGKREEAMTHFRKVIASKLYKTPWIVLTNAGICARGGGERGEAEEFLRRALEADRAFPPALLEMSKLMLESGQHLTARAFMQRYEAAADRSAESLWLGFQIEHALGNSDSAQYYADQLRGRFPDSREALQARRLLSN